MQNLRNISYPLIHTRVCLSGVKKCWFFEKFAYVLNVWSLMGINLGDQLFQLSFVSHRAYLKVIEPNGRSFAIIFCTAFRKKNTPLDSWLKLNVHSQPAITCSKLKIETEEGVKYVQRFVPVSLLLTLNIFYTFSSVCILNLK